MHQTDSEFIGHEPCPSCGSKDNLARYSDGHGFCFGCEYYEPGDCEGVETVRNSSSDSPFVGGDYAPLGKRKVSEDTCRKWGYRVAKHNGKSVQVADYYDPSGSHLVAQKVRYPDKTFAVIGKMKEAGLYGQHLWRDGGKMVVITEGEIDALSVSQLQGNKWPVVSVPNGAQGAKKAIQKQLEWLERFETVVFMFDMDEPGQEAAVECAQLLSPGRAKIARLPLKDANEMLVAGRGGEVIDAIWGAKEYRPEGIVTLSDLKAEVLKPVEIGLPWWSEKLTKLTYGRRLGEIYCFGAGTGIGKTDMLTQQIEYDVSELKEPVGLFLFEQQPVETVKRIAGKKAGKRFHVPDAGWTPEELNETLSGLEASGQVYLFDHFGTADWEIIKRTIRFLARSEGVRLFYIDHLTALATAHEEDEKEALEKIMADMGGMVKELNIIIHLVSHLSTPDGKPHEEGGRVMLRHFKGSRAIGFWTHYAFGMERNPQDADEDKRQVTTFRVLKDRYIGDATGQTVLFGYDSNTGRLYEHEGCPFDADNKNAPTDF